MYGIAIIYFSLCWRYDFSKNWYDTSFIFPIGISFYLRKSKIINAMKKYYIKLCVVGVILFVVTFILNYEKTAIQFIFIRAVSAVCFTFIFNLFLFKVDISNNKLLSFLGSISFEIYLTHNRFPILQKLSNNDNIGVIDIIIYFVIIIMLSIALHRINYYINKFIDYIHNKELASKS